MMPRSRLRSLLLLALALVQAACGAGWRRVEDPLAAARQRPRQQVQVWQAGRARQLHSVVVTADSVSGVPYLEPPDCDSCRIAVPRAAVDSLRFGNSTAGLWRSVGLGAGILLGLAIITCARAKTCNYTD